MGKKEWINLKYEIGVWFTGEHPIIEQKLLKTAENLHGELLGSGYNFDTNKRDLSFEFSNLNNAKQFKNNPISKNINYGLIQIME